MEEPCNMMLKQKYATSTISICKGRPPGYLPSCRLVLVVFAGAKAALLLAAAAAAACLAIWQLLATLPGI